ncbi:MAG: transglycosylase domain-containing protein [Anaerolineae bacterium]|jgi:penicillin-binding protein 1C|nr:transglycosylase domain-containing protein [Anaerolineae bacterium]MDX9830669.1 transglycosylase domain-containing protein [Anaerolineae bacterium]
MNTQEKAWLLRQRRDRRNRARGGASKTLLQMAGGLVVLLITGFVLTVVGGIAAAAGVYGYYAKDLPDPGEIVTRQEKFETTKIYDRTGEVLLMEVIDPRHGDRTMLPLEQIPEDFRNATIALEDKTFYTNIGIDPVGITRAFLLNLQGKGVQGGSSITVQLVKNILIPEEERYQVSYARKIKEAILAMEISRLYSKDQILEWYLNTNYYGNWAIGVEAASQVYFGKHAQDLTLAECTMLAPIVQYPAMNPIDNPDEAKKRQGIALERLRDEGYITRTEAEAAFAEPMQIHSSMLKRYDLVAPHFAVYVRKQLEDRYGSEVLYQGGLKVYTTIDLEIQRIAEEEARAQVAKLKEQGEDVNNAAAVVMRARTGEILAMVGSLDYWNEEIDGNVNVAVAPRQPGSSFKPFSYVTAFHQGHTAADMVMDVHSCFDDYPNPPYCPENYDREYLGPRSFRSALAQSRNIPAVKVLDMVGVGNVIRTAHAMGINTLNQDLDYYGLSLTLGGGEVWLLDMVYAYSVFANGGTMMGQPTKLARTGYRQLDPVSILRVEDAKGEVREEYKQPEVRSVVLADGRELSPQEAYLLTHVLSDNNARAAVFGSNSALRLSRPAAAKTGTTTDYKDVWTVGYTPQIVTGVWVGNNDNTPMEGVSSSRGAAPIWHNVMERIYNEGHAQRILGEVIDNFPRPPGLTTAAVCAVSGLLPNQHCPNRVNALFIEGTEPTEYCNVHHVERVNRQTGKLATACTPPELVEERVYEIYPPEAANWVRQKGIPQPPTQRDEIYGCSPEGGEVVIVDPSLGGHVRDVVAIRGNARSGDFNFYRLEFGEGLNPSAWSQIGGDHYNQVDNDVLEFWDVRGLNDGLYTLQLTVVDHSQNFRRATSYVTVDNTPPEAYVGYPWPGRVYELEASDEWANLAADVRDNVQIDRVEFYMDDELVDFSVVEPYAVKWVLQMKDLRPPNRNMQPVMETRTVTNPDGTVTQEQVMVTWVEISPDGKTVTQTWESGFMIIASSGKYTESHLVHVVAFDAAGNETKSEPVRFFVIHKPKEKKPEDSGALLLRQELLAWWDDLGAPPWWPRAMG